MNIKILGDRILVEADNTESKTKSGVIVTRNNTSPGDYKFGVIVAIGDGKRNDRGEVIPVIPNIGDRIMFQYSADVLVEGKKYLLVNEPDVIWIYKK